MVHIDISEDLSLSQVEMTVSTTSTFLYDFFHLFLLMYI